MRQPSNVVVLENVIREDTKGTTEVVNAKYDLLERGGYIPTGYKFDPVVMNAKLPLEFFEARNALRIAQSEGADRYATDSYQHAVRLMDQADAYATKKNINKKAMIAVAREAVQTAEDAREIAVKKIEQERTDTENRAAADREATAKAQTISAEADTAEALRARHEAERQKRKPKRPLSSSNRPLRPKQNAIALPPQLPLQHRSKNFSKRSVIAKNSARACCNNSTLSSRLATRRAAWSSTCLTFSSTQVSTHFARWRARTWPRSAASCSPIPRSPLESKVIPIALEAMNITRVSPRGVRKQSGPT